METDFQVFTGFPITSMVTQDKLPIIQKVGPGGSLGMCRYKLFAPISDASEKSDPGSKYFGYVSMVDPGWGPTDMLFPAGQADKVFFFTEDERGHYSGSKKLARGTHLMTDSQLGKDNRPIRMWQVATTWSNQRAKGAPAGTLAIFNRLMSGEHLPSLENLDYRLWTNKKLVLPWITSINLTA